MPKKSQLPPAAWNEIRTRFIVNGEKPSAIAKDYDVTPKVISDYAQKRKWVPQRQQVSEELLQTTKDIRQIIVTSYLNEIAEAHRLVAEARERDEIGVTIQDGEGFPNKYIEAAYKAGLDMAKGDNHTINVNNNMAMPVMVQFIKPDDD